MKKKQILFITAFPPSLIAAGEKYTKLLIDELSKNHKIDLIYFKDKNQLKYDPHNNNIFPIKIIKTGFLKKICNIVLTPLFFPLFTVKFNWFLLIAIKKQLKLKRYDIIYFDFSQTFLYAKYIKHDCKILMSHDVIYQRYERRYNSKIINFMCLYSEKIALNCNYNKLYTFSEKDSNLIKLLYKSKSEPTTFFINNNILNVNLNSIKTNYFVFFAMWQRNDNFEGLRWFIENVLPNIKTECAFKIIGMNLPSFFVKEIQKHKNVTYLGFVENPYEIISEAKALISPLFNGAGVKVKVIESLACGTPVIGTSLSFEGITSLTNRECIVANTKEDFVKSIESFNFSFTDKKKLRNLFIETYYNKPVLDYINN